MLSKLLRHEFRATGRILLPLYLLLFVTAGLFNISMGLMDNEHYTVQWPIQIFFGISSTAFVISVIGVSVLAWALMIYRFYKNLMTDEGYLMFTLPVTTHQIIWSKLIVSWVWGAATLLADALAAVLALCRLFDLADLREMWEGILDILAELNTGDVVGYIIESVLLLFFSAAASFLVYYAAIALGHSFANHKILLSVVFYFVFAIAMRIIVSVLTAIVVGATMMDWEELDPFAAGHWGLGLATVLVIVQAVIFYLLTNGMLRKRLNLQ